MRLLAKFPMQTVCGSKLWKKCKGKSTPQKNAVERIQYHINTFFSRQCSDIFAPKRNPTRKQGKPKLCSKCQTIVEKKDEIFTFQSRGEALNGTVDKEKCDFSRDLQRKLCADQISAKNAKGNHPLKKIIVGKKWPNWHVFPRQCSDVPASKKIKRVNKVN